MLVPTPSLSFSESSQKRLSPELFIYLSSFFFFQAEDGIRDPLVTGVQTCALPISIRHNRCSCCLGSWRSRSASRASRASRSALGCISSPTSCSLSRSPCRASRLSRSSVPVSPSGWVRHSSPAPHPEASESLRNKPRRGELLDRRPFSRPSRGRKLRRRASVGAMTSQVTAHRGDPTNENGGTFDGSGKGGTIGRQNDSGTQHIGAQP